MQEKIYKNKEWLEKQFKELKYAQTIGKSIGVSGDTIEYWRKKLNIPKPKCEPASRKYFFNENFFEKIDTEEKAYWLGFIMADGCISTSNKNTPNSRLSIILKKDDLNHLEKFNNSLKASFPIMQKTISDKRGFTTEKAEIRINSTKMCADLIKLGVAPQKTGKELLPKIDECFIKHFIRGFFDGDGSICKQTNTSDKYRFHLGSMSKKIIDQIVYYFLVKHNIELKYYVSNSYSKPFYYIDVNNDKVTRNVMNILYSNANVYLERKHNIIQNNLSPLPATA